ncbi:mitochondrial mRNA pseudouridine synthase Rpusd3-like [Penaeus monodon]|uniref:mitochondrial mRNA pseudouridine synthase Rpusd3-like n=1 Tax=Penaeus monodon TaxID=6687 RepID=UPI0018A7CDF5|nr:mitochondrial mRNA pseudouridine synthase Rpusd3-like [Penaeus monodon]
MAKMFCYSTKNLYGLLSVECRWMACQNMATASKFSFKKKEPKYPMGNFGLDRKERRTLRKRLLEGKEGTVKKHVFKKLYPWQSKKELALHLKSSEVYNDGKCFNSLPLCNVSLISTALPLPMGNCIFHISNGMGMHITGMCSQGYMIPDFRCKKDKGCRIRWYLDNTESEFFFFTSLYYFKCWLTFSPHRWSSGLILLSTNPNVTEKVKKCFRSSQALQQPHMTYWAVTCGMPKPVTVAKKVPFGLEYVPNTGHVPVIKKAYTKADIKRGKMKLAIVEHVTKVFSKESDMSLVEVNVHVTKNHFLRVWLAYSYSPVLGDHFYGGRVKAVAGKKVLVDVQNLTSYVPQTLPNDTFSRLNLLDKAVEMIPCHLHLTKLRLSRFKKDNSDLVITAPPPDHFMWTCRQLGLMTASEGERDIVEENS